MTSQVGGNNKSRHYKQIELLLLKKRLESIGKVLDPVTGQSYQD
jgi:hypothetical protein